MNKTIRTRLAVQLSAIASEHDAAVTVTHESRSCYVQCDFPLVSVSFDLDNLHGGGILASWYGAKRDLKLAAFDSINTSHYRKATLYRASPETFAAAFRRACATVADGSAFAAPWIPTDRDDPTGLNIRQRYRRYRARRQGYGWGYLTFREWAPRWGVYGHA